MGTEIFVRRNSRVEGRVLGSDKILVRRDLPTFWLMGRGSPSSSPPTRGNPDTCLSCSSDISPETFYLYLATLIVKITNLSKIVREIRSYTRNNYFLHNLLFLSLNFWQSGQYHFPLDIFDRCRHFTWNHSILHVIESYAMINSSLFRE